MEKIIVFYLACIFAVMGLIMVGLDAPTPIKVMGWILTLVTGGIIGKLWGCWKD